MYPMLGTSGLDREKKQAAMTGRETVVTVTESDPSASFRLSQDCSLSAFTKRKVRKCFFLWRKKFRLTRVSSTELQPDPSRLQPLLTFTTSIFT